MSVPPSSNDAVKPVADSVDDIITSLGEGEKSEPEVVKEKAAPKEEPKEEEPKEESEEEIPEDDLDILEDEVEEDKIDLKEDDINLHTPPRKKEIDKEFPGFFKKFPWFEKMMFRDKEINEIFGSFDNAKEAASRAESLEELETAFNSGSSVEMFQRMKDADPKVFARVAENILPHLQRVDKDAYFKVTTDLIKRVLIHANNDAKQRSNEELESAVSVLAGYIFPGGFEAPKAEQPSVDPEFERERAEFQQERLRTHVEDVQSRVSNTLRNTVESFIDPKGQMTGYIKKNAIKDVLESVDQKMMADMPFRKQINRMWEDASRAKYSKIHIDKIKSFYLGRAKGLLKPAILAARQEAIKDSPPPQRKEEEKESPKRGIISTGRSTPSRSGKQEMKKGESVYDFLARD